MRLLLVVLAVLGVVVVLGVGGCRAAPDATTLEERHEREGRAVRAWELESPRDGASGPVTLPAHIDRRLLDEPSTYRLRASVPIAAEERGRPLVLAIAHFSALASLRANGRVAPALDTTGFDRYRRTGGLRFRIPEEATTAPTLDLELSVEHRSLMSGWIDGTPTLTTSLDGNAAFAVARFGDRTVAIAALAASLAIALAFGAMAFVERDSPLHRWVVFEALAGALFPAWHLGLLQPIAGTADTALASLGIAAAAVTSIHFTSRHLRLSPKPPSRAWAIALVAHGAVVVLFTWLRASPFGGMRVLGPLTLGFILATAIHHAANLVRVTRQRPGDWNARLSLLGWPLVVLLGANDALSLVGDRQPLFGIRLGSGGVAVVCILQWIALAREHTGLRRDLAQKLDHLDASFREVERLNQELRRQLETRGKHLALALAERAALAGGVLPAPGALLGERYRVDRALGSGGMGTVFEATRLADGRRVAVKIVHKQASPTALARMAREVELLARVRHPNVVEVLDVDVDASGTLFFAMDYVEGHTLAAIAETRPDLATCLDLLAQLAAGLGAVHDALVIHRDLKPSNVLVEEIDEGGARRPRVRVVDFGVSDVVAAPDASMPSTETLGLTRTGARVGTPLYMAPEVLDGGEVDARVDVFAYGLVAFELLTGEAPKPRAQGRPADVVHPALVGARREALVVAQPELGPALVDLLDRCCDAEPGRRPTTQAIADALRDAGARRV